MLFPWGRAAGMVFLLMLGMTVVYRLSQTGGVHIHQACLLAMVVAGTAGAVGLYAISRTWGRDVHWVLAGVMIAGVIRLLIGGGGTAIITFFTEVQRSWFVLFLSVYYAAFLAIDIWLALWVLRHSQLSEREQCSHGNLWDLFS